MVENKPVNDRKQRLSRALRDNLRKRKQQKRHKVEQKDHHEQVHSPPAGDKPSPDGNE